MRSTDPVARHVLSTIMRLEGAPWPAALRAYGAHLLALATRCERPAGKAEMYRWFMRETGGVLVVCDPQRGDDGARRTRVRRLAAVTGFGLTPTETGRSHSTAVVDDAP